MFSDEILEKIFADKETQKVPIGCQSTMIRVIERILEEENVNGFYAGDNRYTQTNAEY